MRILVRKWGNCAAVRIPASLMQAVHLDIDQAVDVTAEDGRIVIEPKQPSVYSLEDLVNGISSANLHEPVDSDPAVGREIW